MSRNTNRKRPLSLPSFMSWGGFLSRATKSSSKRRYLPTIVSLEDRIAPAVFTPLPVFDGLTGSLRDAIQQADTNDDASNTIILQPATYTITKGELADPKRKVLLSVPAKTLNIIGATPPGDGVIQSRIAVDATATGAKPSRVFEVEADNTTLSVLFQNIIVAGGQTSDHGAVSGVTGALGGGLLDNGGMVTLSHVGFFNNEALGGKGRPGAKTQDGSPGQSARGGAVYLGSGSLTIRNSAFNGNTAIGGEGGTGGVPSEVPALGLKAT